MAVVAVVVIVAVVVQQAHPLAVVLGVVVAPHVIAVQVISQRVRLPDSRISRGCCCPRACRAACCC